jgi:uncharacterized membrane protein YsdA (DUF1294 family)
VPVHVRVGGEKCVTVWFLLAWFTVMNLTAYYAYATDKTRALNGGYRIPEQRLLIIAAMGGSIGAIAARLRLRHKTRKQPFADMLLLTVGLQLGATFSLCVLVLLIGA